MKISKDVKAGIIVIIAFLGFWYAFQFMKGSNVFASENKYYVHFDDVSGLEQSKPVTINGMRVGRVESIESLVNETNGLAFKVNLLIDKAYPMYKNSVAEIFEPGLMAGKEIRIIYPKEKIPAPAGSYLIGQSKSSLLSSLGDEVGPLKDNLYNVLESLDQTLKTANATLNNVNNDLLSMENKQSVTKALANLNTTIATYQTTAQKLNQLVANNDQKVASALDNASATFASANSAVKKYGGVADKLEKLEVEQTLAKLQTTLTNLNSLIEKMNNGDGTMGKLMNDPQLYNNLTSASKSLNNLLVDFKSQPKRYIHFSVFGRKDKPQPTDSEIEIKTDTKLIEENKN